MLEKEEEGLRGLIGSFFFLRRTLIQIKIEMQSLVGMSGL